MGWFNLKHSNRLSFFSHKLCSTLSDRQGELEQSAVFTCRIHFFFCISTLYTRRRGLKKGKVCTNAVHYDKLGNGDVLQRYIQCVQPTPEIRMPSGSQKAKISLFVPSSLVLDFLFDRSNVSQQIQHVSKELGSSKNQNKIRNTLAN